MTWTFESLGKRTRVTIQVSPADQHAAVAPAAQGKNRESAEASAGRGRRLDRDAHLRGNGDGRGENENGERSAFHAPSLLLTRAQA
jgi:hypothetical protein